MVFVRIFPLEKCRDVGAVEPTPLMAAGWGWKDQGSPTLERFANRLDFEIFKTS